MFYLLYSRRAALTSIGKTAADNDSTKEMTDMSSTVASQSAFANTEDEEEHKPLLDPRFDELLQKVEILSQKVQLNEKEKIADVKEQARPLLDHCVDNLMTEHEEVPHKRDDNEKDKCGDEIDQTPFSDPRLNKMMKKIEDLILESKEKEDLSKKREHELVMKVQNLIKGKETRGKIISDQNLNDLAYSFQINETNRNLPDVRVDELMKIEEFQKEKENLSKTISDLQEQVSSLIRNSNNESPDGVNFVRADENLDALELQISDQTQDAQDWNENEIRLVYDIASVFTCLLRFPFFGLIYFLITINLRAYWIVILTLSVAFEMMTTTFDLKLMKIANFANVIGWTLCIFNNGRPFSDTQDVVGAVASYKAMVGIAAVLIVFGQVVIMIGVMKYQKSRLRKAAYIFNAYPSIWMIYFRCVKDSNGWLLIATIPCFFIHQMFLFFGLPASKSNRDILNQNHHTNSHPSKNPEDSASRDSIQPNAPLTSSNVHHRDLAGLDTPIAHERIKDTDFQLQQENISLQNTLTISATDQNMPSSYKHHQRNRLSILYGVDKDANIKGELERDIYTMMMLSHWKHRSFRIPKCCCCSWCRNKYYIVFVPFPSKSWIMGFAVFSVQFALGVLIILDQLNDPTFKTTMNIPPRIDPVVRTGQFMTVLLALFSQTDVTITLYNLFQLWYGSKSQWNKVIGEEHDTSFKLWLGRVFVPNVLKISQGITILIASCIIILQSDNIVDLLKDCTALFVISSVDDIIFIMVDHGYYGVDLSNQADRLKNIEIREVDKKIRKRLQIILVAMIVGFLGGWIYVVVGQINGRYFAQKYPACLTNYPINYIDDNMNTVFSRKNGKYLFYMENNVCDFPAGVGPNNARCGWEGGDCTDLNQKFDKYPLCPVSANIFDPFTGDWKKKYKYSSFIDNIICDFAKGVGPNIEECGWEGGDCLVFNQQYPNCTESKIYLIQNGQCDSETNIEECGFDGNDCLEENVQLKKEYPNCSVRSPSWIGDNTCDGFDYNTTECGWDGGDCLVLQQEFPKCKGRKSNIGTGICGGRRDNTKECGWDGGDCFDFNQKHPFCKTGSPLDVGDGRCDKENNVMGCGWDGGDCVEWNKKYPYCKAFFTEWIGDGVCDGGEYNVEECGFDGGDCAN